MPNDPKLVTCRGCGAPIFFLKTPHGKNHPVDANPVKVWIQDAQTGAWTLQAGFVSHFATCPQADAFRGRGPIQDAPAGVQEAGPAP